MPSRESITFDTSDLKFEREEPGRKIWLSKYGDGISLNFFNKPPDLPANLQSVEQLRGFYEGMLQNSPAKLVEVGTTILADCRAALLIIKSPQQPTGMTYVGSITIPFRAFSYVLKVQCAERGTTGVRETILFQKLFAARQVTLGAGGKISGDWTPDDEKYDEQFPQHPLSRVRAVLRKIKASCSIDAMTRGEPKFLLP